MPGFDESVVAQIKALEEEEVDGRLEQGDLIERLVPTGKNGAHNANLGALEALAGETGIAPETLRQRRRVAKAIPPGMRIPGVAWDAWLLLAGLKEEARLGHLQQMRDGDPDTPSRRWTIDAVLGLVGREPKARTGTKLGDGAPLAVRVAEYKRLQKDTEVLDALARELLQAGKQTPEEKLKRDLEEARRDRDAFKASRQALEDSLALVNERLAALEGVTPAPAPLPAGTGVEGKAAEEMTEEQIAMAGHEARVQDLLAKDVAYQYVSFVGPLENFSNRNEPGDVALALLTDRVPIPPENRIATASKVADWLTDLAQALRETPRVRFVRPVEAG